MITFTPGPSARFTDVSQRRRREAGPPITYEFRPPFLFDCRWQCTRRVGIGDKIVVMQAIKRVVDEVGRDAVRVWGNIEDCGLWSMAPGLNVYLEDPAVRGTPPGIATHVNLRHHPMEYGVPEDGIMPLAVHGHATGCPVDQVFYALGWHRRFNGAPLDLELVPTGAACEVAGRVLDEIGAWRGDVVTMNPLMVSRGAGGIEPACWAAWKRVVDGLPAGTVVLVGDGPGGQGPALTGRWQNPLEGVGLAMWQGFLAAALNAKNRLEGGGGAPGAGPGAAKRAGEGPAQPVGAANPAAQGHPAGTAGEFAQFCTGWGAGRLGGVHVVRVGLGAWQALIQMAGRHVTANTGGMWMGMASTARLTVVQRPSTFDHGRMWDWKRWWQPGRTVELVEY